MKSSPASMQFRIRGLDCAEEVAVLKRELAPVVGGEDRLVFDILNAKMTVHPPGGSLKPETVIRAVARTGMRADVWRDVAQSDTSDGTWQHYGKILTTILSGVLTLIGFLVHVVQAGGVSAAISSEGLGPASHVPPAAQIAYSLAILAAFWSVFPKAWRAAAHFRPDMNLLMTVAVIGAIAIGEWFEAATVAFLFAASLALESRSVARARRAIAALLEVAPPQARLADASGAEKLLPVELVPVGSRIVVKPGERIPLDGRVDTGNTTVNESPITGESMPVAKNPGDTVFAGAINEDGAIEVITHKSAGDTVAAQIVKTVREAQSKRSPSEQWVERFSRFYTPAVMSIAVLVAVIPPLLFGHWASWFYQALVLLVIACPCALVISTPVSVVSALVAAANNGVLIKGGAHVETPSRLRAIALDKTGTITEGKPSVIRIVPLSGHSETELLEIAAAIELRSEHPLARAIVHFAAEKGIQPAAAANYRAIKGKGATAEVGGIPVWIGSHRYLEWRGQETSETHSRLDELGSTGHSVVVVGNEDHACGFIALADRVRPNAAETIRALRKSGVKRIVMLTGDNTATAEAVSLQCGIDEFRAELLPEEKVRAVEDLLERFQIVGMVGDGINDAPALARSSLAVAMGSAGTAAALEAADVALMADDLSRLPWLVNHSRRVLRIIRQNVTASLTVKAAFVALTLSGHASIWAAIAADTGISLLVVFNALRLLSEDRSGADCTAAGSEDAGITGPSP